MTLFRDKYFHIPQVLQSAWSYYGWDAGDKGLRLSKKKVDKLAKKNIILYVSYGNSFKLHTITAKDVQEYPIESIKYGKVQFYTIPVSSLRLSTQTRIEIEELELHKLGVFD